MIHFKKMAILALTTTGLALSGSAWAISYTATVLQPFDFGNNSYGGAINNAGLAVGVSNFFGVLPVTTLWNNNVATESRFSGTFVTDINNSGQITGSQSGSSYQFAAWWNGTQFVSLRSIAETNGSINPTGHIFYGANAVNDVGQVVGYSPVSYDVQNNHATLWSGTATTDLGTLGGDRSSATDINNAGLVAGSSQIAGNTASHATLWNGTTITDLGTLGGTNSFAYGINNAGLVAGASQIAGSAAYHATLWNGTTLTDLGTLGGANSIASAINNAGQVVGYSEIAGSTGFRATLWNDASAIDLNSFLDPSLISAGWILESAVDINDNGWIVANASNIKPENSSLSLSFLLKPTAVPLPAALWFFGSGFLGLLGVARRKVKVG